MSLLEFDRMGIERCERVRETERKGGGRGGELEGEGGRRTWGEGPQRCPGTPGTCCLSLTLTHFPAQMKGFVLLRSAALISHQHISSSTQFTPIAEIVWLCIWCRGGKTFGHLEVWWGLLWIRADKLWKTSSGRIVCCLAEVKYLKVLCRF